MKSIAELVVIKVSATVIATHAAIWNADQLTRRKPELAINFDSDFVSSMVVCMLVGLVGSALAAGGGKIKCSPFPGSLLFQLISPFTIPSLFYVPQVSASSFAICSIIFLRYCMKVPAVASSDTRLLCPVQRVRLWQTTWKILVWLTLILFLGFYQSTSLSRVIGLMQKLLHNGQAGSRSMCSTVEVCVPSLFPDVP